VRGASAIVAASRHKQAPCHRHRHRRMKLIVEVSYDQRLGYVARHP
jgi:hypothetical protein